MTVTLEIRIQILRFAHDLREFDRIPVWQRTQRVPELDALPPDASAIWHSAANTSGAAWDENFARAVVVTVVSIMIQPGTSRQLKTHERARVVA